MKLEDLDDVLTVNEVAKFLKISKTTGYTFIRENKLKYVKIRGQKRIYKTDLIDFINSGKYENEY